MRAFFFLYFLFPAIAGYSQKVIDVSQNNLPVTSNLFYTVGGEPVSNAKYVMVVEGSPFFSESWMKGKIVMSGGFVYNNIYLRIDLIENAIRYLAPDGKEMIATSPIRSVILSDSVTGKEFKFVNSRFMLITGKIENGWYQMLDTGYATLYKHFTKVISENKPYGASTTEQKINAYGSYFVMVKAVLNPIKKIKELPDLLNDKKEELKAYLSTKNLSGRSDADYIALITYYNSLFLK